MVAFVQIQVIHCEDVLTKFKEMVIPQVLESIQVGERKLINQIFTYLEEMKNREGLCDFLR